MPRLRFLPVPLLLLPLLWLLPAAPSGADAAAWQRQLGKGDADEQFATLVRAGQSGDASAAIPLLDYALGAFHPHLAVAAGEALHALGWPGADAAARQEAEKWFERALKSKEQAQINLARALGAWGDPIVDAPLAHLASGRRTEAVQVEALFMAGSLSPTPEQPFPQTRDVIDRALKGRTASVRCAACSAAGRRREGGLVDALVEVVRRERDPYTGLYAVWALKRIGYSGGISTFVHVLSKTPRKTTMQACLKAVTELSSESDVPDLLALSRNSKKDYRDAAALALGRLVARGRLASGGEVTPGPDGAPPPAPELPTGVVERLVTMVEGESDWEVRDAARQSLLRIGKPAEALVRSRLPRAIDFGNEDARLNAIELTGRFGAQEAYRSLLKTALYDSSRTARMFAARALEGAGPEEAVKDLLTAAQAAGRRPRDHELQAVRALGYVRHPGAFDALLGLMEGRKGGSSASDPVLKEVEYSLERLTGHRFGLSPERWRTWYARAEHPLHPMISKYDRSANRRDAVEKGLYGLGPSTERAVENGLRWLELQQHDIGLWDGNEKGFGGVIGCEPAYTGLALLAFLGAGYNGARGKYRETVRRAAEFLAATQFYDGGFPVTGGGDDSWIFAYLISMGVWGITEGYALSGDEALREPAQWGIDYLVRVQTHGAGWRYGPRYVQSDTSCTSWVLMALKAGQLVGLDVAQRSIDGIDSWLDRCSYDITGEEEIPEDLSTDYDYEVGSRRYFKAFTGYFELSGSEKSAAQQTSMTAVGMVCRMFMGWKRSHPFLIGCANYLMDYLPRWMKGLEKGQAVAWYHYFWYYGTLGMHQMGGRYWRAWNENIKRMYVENQRTSPAELAGSWDPDTAVLNGGRLFSTAMSILSLETYYRFSPLMSAEVERAPEGDGAR